MSAIALGLPSLFRLRKDAGRVVRLGRYRGGGATDDAELVEHLRAGDEDAFRELVERYGMALLGVARMYVKDRAAAEEVVQETWLAVLQGIDRFEGLEPQDSNTEPNQ